jgi:phosphate-selective porin
MPRCLWEASVALALGAAMSRAALGQVATPSSVTLTGALQVRETYQGASGLTATVNRARLGAAGRLGQGIAWRLLGEFRTGNAGTGRASVSLLDAYLRYGSGPWVVQAGQYKVPFSHQYLTTFFDVETADRSAVVDALAPKRDIGVMGQYGYRQIATLTAGVFNGEGQNVTSNADSTVLGAARLALRPLRGVVLGANLARYFGDSTRYGVDAGYEGSTLTLRAEYLAQTRDAQALPRDRGWYAVAAYFLVPSVQVVSQYETFSRPGIAAVPRNRAWTAGAHWFPMHRDLRLTAEYISRSLGDPGVRSGQLLSQVQVRF